MVHSHLEISAKPTEDSGNVSFSKYELVTVVNDKETDREDITSKIENGSYDGQFSKTITAGLGAIAEAMYDGDSIYDQKGNLLSRR